MAIYGAEMKRSIKITNPVAIGFTYNQILNQTSVSINLEAIPYTAIKSDGTLETRYVEETVSGSLVYDDGEYLTMLPQEVVAWGTRDVLLDSDYIDSNLVLKNTQTSPLSAYVRGIPASNNAFAISVPPSSSTSDFIVSHYDVHIMFGNMGGTTAVNGINDFRTMTITPMNLLTILSEFSGIKDKNSVIYYVIVQIIGE